MQLDKPKFCRDCQHYRPTMYYGGRRIGEDMCVSPNIEPDMVTGWNIGDPGQMRRGAMFCTVDANWFEPKPAPELVRLDEPGRPWWKFWGN